jgi:hypothetical protein
MAGWLTYKSAYEGLSFRYPSDWKLTVKTDSIPGWHDVSTATITSKDGFALTLDSHIEGLGGACAPADCPYVQTLTKEPMPHISGSYFIEREVRSSDNKTVISRDIGAKAPVSSTDQVPNAGSVQGFAYYLVFPSRGVDKALAEFSGSYMNNSPELKQPTSSFLNSPDVITGRQIIESATY